MTLLAQNKVRKSIAFGAVGLAFSAVVGLVATSLAGAGHGSAFFGAVVWAPAPFGALIWPAIGIFLPWSRKLWVIGAIGVLLVLNYFASVEVFLVEDGFYLTQTIEHAPGVVTFVAGAYLAAQILILARIGHSLSTRREEPAPN